MIVRTIRAADSAPGVLGTLLGKTCFLYGAHEEARLQGPPGEVLARRDGAICIGTVDGAVWISHLKAKDETEAREVPCLLAQAGIGCELCDAEFCFVAGICGRRVCRDPVLSPPAPRSSPVVRIAILIYVKCK
jgi:putative two-component system hydrogenase maturation factor HypX/HoxX